MGSVRKYNFSLLIVFLCATIAFALSYNVSMKAAVSTALEDNKALLKSNNSIVIKKLTSAENMLEWEDILNGSNGVIMSVFDSDNNIIAKSKENTETSLDISEISAFEYKGKAYLLKSSVFILQGLSDDTSGFLNFVLTEFTVALAILILIALVIYTVIVRPYKEFYRSIEEYEKTGVFHDKKFTGYIGRVYERFGAMTKNLEHQKQNQERIVASISHDIKTPLTSIMGYSERLRKDNISPERRQRYLDTVYTKSLEIRELVDEFDEYLSYKMLQNIKMEERSTQSICKMLDAEYSDELESLGVSFDIINKAPNASVMIDNTKMRRVFGNIIGNSLKHFKTGKEKKISVTIEESSKSILIHIDDNGEGIDKEKTEVIFEPLYTSDKGRKVAGLGLSICREIVESHGGKIEAAQSDLGGMRINIELLKNDKNVK